ncbi:hypothetical protein CEUSTIGMA_g9837.t1 [Chlamydomonas eustigma]|uniref:Dynamin N-terminal domain-containing protein n=1 Tax=Chlamydomonas eustigma TaxID=1157962 RepID=A0A250XHL0_9CHLO|nr:hypothetical protein CEUSTIGMA_g9837.t1 [Chlamydomonas eustigma]|eukprot:GAX82409.1 hypothetical protein CEUSTIGMA_g9837.t1 [Chlamydomonas eustigma]
MAASNSKKKNGRNAVDEALAGATEKVLKQITELYDVGLSNTPGAMGLKAISESPLLKMNLRKPRKKITVMIVGNHSAGKSSFINWYIGEGIQKTGVAIETRGFTFVTSGKKRETLTGEATIRFYDFLEDFGKFEGIVHNLFTEISTSKEKNFICTDLIDTPGLVDGDMQYPFNVQDAIIHMAEHVDLILVFLDPIGQATCKRTMEVVEKLNQSPHLEKIHYFMSKADAVEKEHDRQRVLIQITQNLAKRIRNSHAFNLPTFYLPREDGSDPGIPNAIEEVCKEVDKAINMTVQKNLRQLKDDCEKVIIAIAEAVSKDREKKAANARNRFKGILFYALSLGMVILMVLLLAARILPSLCLVSEHLCEAAPAKFVVKLEPVVAEHFKLVGGVLLVTFLASLLIAKLTWQISHVFTKSDLKKLEEYKMYVKKIADQEKGLYEEYFKSLSNSEDR